MTLVRIVVLLVAGAFATLSTIFLFGNVLYVGATGSPSEEPQITITVTDFDRSPMKQVDVPARRGNASELAYFVSIALFTFLVLTKTLVAFVISMALLRKLQQQPPSDRG